MELLSLLLGAILLLLLGYLLGRYATRRSERAVRQDAVKRSRAVLSGQFSEQLAPYLPNFSWAPTEARFLGKPIDFLIFKGMDSKQIDEVVFVEVKSGKSSLSSVERSLRDAIKDGRVTWEEYRIPEKLTK